MSSLNLSAVSRESLGLPPVQPLLTPRRAAVGGAALFGLEGLRELRLGARFPILRRTAGAAVRPLSAAIEATDIASLEDIPQSRVRLGKERLAGRFRGLLPEGRPLARVRAAERLLAEQAQRELVRGPAGTARLPIPTRPALPLLPRQAGEIVESVSPGVTQRQAVETLRQARVESPKDIARFRKAALRLADRLKKAAKQAAKTGKKIIKKAPKAIKRRAGRLRGGVAGLIFGSLLPSPQEMQEAAERAFEQELAEKSL